ncbi:MAG: hypothetical protein JO250_09155 [Armatimonadetes bacterium]|nr:hypothetical protein [Armatimonadota bacterium]
MPPTFSGFGPLAILRIQAIFRELVEENDLPGRRLWSERIPVVDAADDEIMARMSGQVVAADIIETDQAAVVHSAEPIRLTRTEIPKIKHGQLLSETMLLLIMRIEKNMATTGERNFFDDYVANSLRRLLSGVQDRVELLLNQMVTESGASYSRYGINMQNVSWNTPPTLNLVPTTLHTSVNATPISDFLSLKQQGSFLYGEEYDTLTISTQELRNIIATNEYRSLEPLYRMAGMPANLPVNVSQKNLEYARSIVGNMLTLEVECYDRRTHEEQPDGTRTTTRFMPENKAVLTDSSQWGSSLIWDFANGIVPETIPGMVPGIIGGDFDGEQAGPISFATAANLQGNPPGQVLWAAQRGFPRKHWEAGSAVLTCY